MAGKRRAGGGQNGPDGQSGDGQSATARRRFGRGPKKPKQKWSFWRIVRRAVLVLVALLVTGALVIGAGFAYLYQTTDIPKANEGFQTQTSFVYFNNNKDELGRYAVQNREIITYDQIPTDIKNAVVAIENPTFWSDNGVDFKAIIRAALNNARGGNTQGASTITQQYIKVMYLTQERSYTRKLKEAVLALKLQRQKSKQEILDSYLNTIYFGRGAYGVQAAAKAWFQVDAQDLTLQQSAVLASVINNPTQYDPANGKDSKKALHVRYRKVLDDMAAQDKITAADAKQTARQLPTIPEVATQSQYGGQRGHVLTMVKNALLQLPNRQTGHDFTDDEINGGGLHITTTFTHTAMDAAKAGVLAERPDGFSDKQLHIAVASVQPGTGAVRGIYAGQDYLESQINWAIAGGQAGSSVKPFSLAAGLKAGFSLKDTFDGNSPFDFAGDGGKPVQNEQNKSYGAAVNLIYATEQSINTAFTDLTLSIPDGPQAVVDMMEAFGIPPKVASKTDPTGFPTSTPGLDPYPSVTLGAATISPINLANAYATIANGGVAATPFIIQQVTDASGTVLYKHQVQTHRAVSADIDDDVSYALQQVVQHGTGTTTLGLGRPAAGKTGTATNGFNQVDSAWFTGYTPQMATSVMYVRGKGNEQLDGWLPSYFGAGYPAATWTAVMQAEMEGLPVEEFPPPANVDGTPPDTGHTPTSAPPSPTRTPKPSPTQTSSSPTSKPTNRPTRTPTPTPSPTATATFGPIPSETPTPAPTPTDTCGVLGCGTPSTAPPAAPASPAARTAAALRRSALGLSW